MERVGLGILKSSHEPSGFEFIVRRCGCRGRAGGLNSAEFVERGVSHVPTYISFAEILCRNPENKEKTPSKIQIFKNIMDANGVVSFKI